MSQIEKTDLPLPFRAFEKHCPKEVIEIWE
jgi:hypothetical protein